MATVIAKRNFFSSLHGSVRRGDYLEVSEPRAAEMQRLGLVARVQSIPQNKMAPDHSGKLQDDGTGRPSSLSRQAPASPLTTASASDVGETKRVRTPRKPKQPGEG